MTQVGYTMKYRLSPLEIPQVLPSVFPLGSGDISLYTPPLVTIQLQFIDQHEMSRNTEQAKT